MPSYVLVLYYSRHGSVESLASHIARGIEQVDGIEAKIRTVPPVSATTEATDKAVPDTGAPYVTLEELENCDGLALGSPGRFGNMAAPLKFFLETTSGLWMSGKLINKPASVFTSTSSMHGGQETTLTSMMTPLMHHGMIIVGSSYATPELASTKSGGTPYGSSHVAGVDNVPLTDEEIVLATQQGRRLAEISVRLRDTR